VNDFGILAAAADGMAAERGALDVAARNVALAQTADPHHPVRRLEPRFVLGPPIEEGDGDDEATFAALVGRDTADDPGDETRAPVVRFAGAVPGVGDADAMTEMVAALDAQRAYESNASIFQLGKHLAERTIDIERS
jgi:flagellar basal body rod protein FlgC